MREARAHIAAGRRVGVLFGPERAGLENEDLTPATAFISVPVNPDFPSLNLAQCVLLVAYEWRRLDGEGASAGPLPEVPGGALANGQEIEHLRAHFEERLEDAGFFFPADKAPRMREGLRNMLGRLPLTRGDVQLFHGMLRQFDFALRRALEKAGSRASGGAPQDPSPPPSPMPGHGDAGP